MDENGTYSWPGGQNTRPKKKPDFKRAGRTVIAVIAALLVLAVALTCFYTVDDKQQAVVTTFGKVTNVTEAGVHFKLPLGIQKVEKVDVNVYQKIELGYSSSGNSYEVNDSESTMITGDYNIVNVDFFVEYKISDPVQYLYSSNEPELILRNLIQSQIRNVVGSSSVDAVLTDGNYDASIIRNDVDKQVNIIVSDAEASAAKLEAEGEQEYMRLLAEAYDTQDKKDFYEFSLALDALKASLNGDEKTVILDANSELAKILMGGK